MVGLGGWGWCLRPTAWVWGETREKAPGDTHGAKMGEGREAHREGRRRSESQGAWGKGSFLEIRRSVSRGAGDHSVRCQRKAQWQGDREEELG